MKKSTKSHLRGFSILLKIFFRVHELVARALRGKCVRHGVNGASRRFCRSPQFQLYHACEHITRKSRADSCTHCLHARWIMGGAGVGLVPALTKAGIFATLLLRGIDRFAKRTRSASPRQGELTDLRSKRGRRRRAVILRL